MNTPFCRDTTTIKHTGAGTAGAHTTVVSLLPGRYALTGGGNAGGSTTTAKLIDNAGNLFPVLGPGGSAAAIPAADIVDFFTPGASLQIATTGAGAGTALTITVGKID